MSIVLVGNGPSAKYDLLGEEIDKFDEVYRFNCFQLTGYEKYLGTKTTTWVINQSGQDTLKNIEKINKGLLPMPLFNELLLAPNYGNLNRYNHNYKKYSDNEITIDMLKQWPYVKHFDKPIKMLPRQSFKNAIIQSNITRRHATTGLMAIQYLLDSGHEKIYIHGFDIALSSNPQAKHYYKDEYYGDKSNIMKSHQPVKEHQYFKRLINEGKVIVLKTKPKTIRVISYYTDNNYKLELNRLEKSLNNNGHNNYKFYEMENRGNWIDNCLIKPEVILKSIEESNHDIIYLDADAEAIGKLEHFNDMTKPISFFQGPKAWKEKGLWPKSVTSAYACGTMFFKNCQDSKVFLRRWIEICKSRNDLSHDGHGIYFLMQERSYRQMVQPLPAKYLVIFDKAVTLNLTDKRVIHHQASRRLKKKVKKTNKPPIVSNAYSIENVLSLIAKPPKTLYNIGIGHLPHCEAKQFKDKYPNINIFGVEPQSKVFSTRNEYPGKKYNIGIWSTAGIKTLNLTKDLGNSSILNLNNDLPDNKKINIIGEEKIICITLNNFDDLCNNPEDIFIWMDIEGAEFEALKGAKKLLKSKRVKYIDLEISKQDRRHKDNYRNELIVFLSGYGYNPILTYNDQFQSFNNVLFKLK